jgi:cytochrome P450
MNDVIMLQSWLIDFNFLTYRAMLYNEDDYPDPSAFKPERFMKKDGQLDQDIRDPALIAFGFGRR